MACPRFRDLPRTRELREEETAPGTPTSCGCARPAASASAAPTASAPPRPPAPTEDELFRRAALADLQVNLSDIYFDFDRSDLRADARDTLARNADWLKKSYNTAVIQIEGHCDERGTNQYNLSLGERRARAALDYLVSLGVPASRVSMISYGEERPQCTESSEDCWQKNRRAHSLVAGK